MSCFGYKKNERLKRSLIFFVLPFLSGKLGIGDAEVHEVVTRTVRSRFTVDEVRVFVEGHGMDGVTFTLGKMMRAEHITQRCGQLQFQRIVSFLKQTGKVVGKRFPAADTGIFAVDPHFTGVCPPEFETQETDFAKFFSRRKSRRHHRPHLHIHVHSTSPRPHREVCRKKIINRFYLLGPMCP